MRPRTHFVVTKVDLRRGRDNICLINAAEGYAIDLVGASDNQ